MSIKKQIRKIGETVKIDYNSSQKIYKVSTSTKIAENYSLKKALKEIRRVRLDEKTVSSE